MKSIYSLIFLCIIVATLSCKSGSGESKNPDSTQKNKGNLPGLDADTYNHLLEHCDFIDYIFYDSPASMSQEEKSSILANLRFISSDPVSTLNKSCKPMARIVFSANADIYLEADVYFNARCTYYLFLKNNVPFAANLMTADGANFYNNILKQINSSNPNG